MEIRPHFILHFILRHFLFLLDNFKQYITEETLKNRTSLFPCTPQFRTTSLSVAKERVRENSLK